MIIRSQLEFQNQQVLSEKRLLENQKLADDTASQQFKQHVQQELEEERANMHREREQNNLGWHAKHVQHQSKQFQNQNREARRPAEKRYKLLKSQNFVPKESERESNEVIAQPTRTRNTRSNTRQSCVRVAECGASGGPCCCRALSVQSAP